MQELTLIAIYITEAIQDWLALKGIWNIKIPYAKAFGIGLILFSALIFGGVIREGVPLIWVLTPPLILLPFVKERQTRITFLRAWLLLTINELIGLGVYAIRKEEGIKEYTSQYLLVNVIYIGLLIVCYIAKTKTETSVYKKIRTICEKHIYLIVIIIGIILIFTVWGIYIMSKYTGNEFVKGLLFPLTFLSLLGIPLSGIFFAYVDDENKRINKHLETERMLLKTQKKFYETMLAKETDTRKFRHDIKNHLICLEELTARNEIDKVKEYVDELLGGLQGIEKKCYTVGNTVMDSIINHYTQLLAEDVAIEIRGVCNCDLDISEVDLCTIVSNLVQNAIEEINRENMNNPYFKMKFHTSNTFVDMEIINSIPANKEISPDKLSTSKADKQNHGIGLENVRETIEKNRGKLYTIIEENEFKVRIVLPIKRNF